MQAFYHSQDIQAWEQRWFAQQNSAYGLMQQVAWQITQRLQKLFQQHHIQQIAICCGQGNNAGDGYLIAVYLQQLGFDVTIYHASKGQSELLRHAIKAAQAHQIAMIEGFEFKKNYDAYIDALFGIGLNRSLDLGWQKVIQQMNRQTGLKIAIDIPSGLNANTGQPMPCAVQAQHCYSVLAYKAGLFTGQGKTFCGKLELIDLIPKDQELQPLGHIAPTAIELPKRDAHGHKGTYGHVLVLGGHPDMGGAVIMAAEAAFRAGAGKVTVVCAAKHHTAIVARAPNIMIRDIDQLNVADIQQLLAQVDAVCMGMGLGRDQWAEHHYSTWMQLIENQPLELVLDADALWFLAKYPRVLGAQTYLTPHPGEAATLLNCSVSDVENDRIETIYQLQKRYGGQWVLKGAGSLTLNEQLWICTAGNAGMGTGGMGDILAGMIASLKAQFHDQIGLHDVVTLHALAGDELAKQGMQGLQAHHMPDAVYRVLNRKQFQGTTHGDITINDFG